MTPDGSMPARSRYELLCALVVARAEGPGAPSGTPSGPPDVVTALAAICRSAVERLPVQGAAVSLVSASASASVSGAVSGATATQPGPVTAGVAAASDPEAHAHAELSFTTGEGPAAEAVAAHRPVLVADLAASGARWPGYTSLAADAGLGAVFAFPLHVGGVVLGVLEMYAATPGSLGDDPLGDASTYAQIATDVLLDGRLLLPGGALDSGVASALDYRAEIHQAQGMLMVSLGITLTDALVRMRSYAFTSGRPLIDVARDIHDGLALDDEH